MGEGLGDVAKHAEKLKDLIAPDLTIANVTEQSMLKKREAARKVEEDIQSIQRNITDETAKQTAMYERREKFKLEIQQINAAEVSTLKDMNDRIKVYTDAIKQYNRELDNIERGVARKSRAAFEKIEGGPGAAEAVTHGAEVDKGVTNNLIARERLLDEIYDREEAIKKTEDAIRDGTAKDGADKALERQREHVNLLKRAYDDLSNVINMQLKEAIASWLESLDATAEGIRKVVVETAHLVEENALLDKKVEDGLINTYIKAQSEAEKYNDEIAKLDAAIEEASSRQAEYIMKAASATSEEEKKTFEETYMAYLDAADKMREKRDADGKGTCGTRKEDSA
jgi:hypothetical protein